MSKHASKSTKNSHPSDINTYSDTDGVRGSQDTNGSARSLGANDGDISVNHSKSDMDADVEEISDPYPMADASRHFDKSAAKTLIQDAKKVGEETHAKVTNNLDMQSVKKNLNLVKNKAQNILQSSKEQISQKYETISDDVKLRGMLVDDKIKANPYVYALGAAGIGFIVGRALSGKGKKDLDYLMTTVNQIHFSSFARLLGVKVSEEIMSETKSKEEMKKEGYSENQARRIG